MSIGGARVGVSFAALCSVLWTSLSGCGDTTVENAAADVEALVSSAPQPTAASLPSPDLGACAFVPATSCLATKNALCPSGIFRGDLIVHDAKDLAAVKGCQRIAGDVVILSETLRDLSGLDTLQVIEGNLVIGGRTRMEMGADNFQEFGANQLLESLHGLEQLRCVGRGLLVTQGNVCKPLDASALGKLTEVGGAMAADSWCEGRPRAASFASLRRVWGDAAIGGVDALPALESVYGRSSIAAEVSAPKLSYVGCDGGAPMCRDGVLGCAFYAQSQADVAALKDCKLAVGELQLTGTDIVDLRPLSKLREVRGNFGILLGPSGAGPNEEGELASLVGLEKLEAAHSLGIGRSPKLQSLAPLANLRSLTANRDAIAFRRDVNYEAKPEPSELRLYGLTGLRDLSELRSLRQVQGTLGLFRCDQLTGIRELKNVSVAGLYLANDAALRSPEGPTYASTLYELTLQGLPALRDLRGLQSVQDVASMINVRECGQLTTLSELCGLKHAPEMYVTDDPQLASLTGLSALQGASILTLQNLPMLKSIAALRALRTVDSLNLTDLPSLPSLDGLQSLSASSEISLSGLGSLTSLAGLSGLTQVGHLGMGELGKVQDLQGISARAVIDSLGIVDMPALGSLKGLPAQASGALSDLQLIDNPVLTDLSALGWLKRVESLYISGNSKLRDLSGLNALVHATSIVASGDFSLRPLRALAEVSSLEVDGPASATLNELSNVRTLGWLNITDAAGAIGLTPPALDYVEWLGIHHFAARDFSGLVPFHGIGFLLIDDSADLESLDGMQSTASAVRDVALQRNARLASLRGLETLHGSLGLLSDDALRDLTGLSGITTLTSLGIYSNARLETLDGLEQLASTGDIDLRDNPLLRDLHGLRNASFQTPGSNRLSVDGNASLPGCEVAWLATHFDYPLELLGSNGPEGTCEP